MPLLDDHIAELQRQSLMERGRVLSPNTVRSVTERLKPAAVRCPDRNLPEALSERSRSRALLAAIYSDQAPQGARNTVLALMRYGDFLVERRVIAHNYVTREDVPRTRSQRAVNVFTNEETELLVLAGEYMSERMHLAMLSLVDTGLRVGELLGLTYDHMVLDQRPPRYVLPTTKTEPRIVVLSPRLTKAWQAADVRELRYGTKEPARNGIRQLRKWSRSAVLHPFPWSYPTFNRLFAGLCEDAGVPQRNVHALRHAAATRWLAEGRTDLYGVSKLLGHATPNTTARYYAHLGATDYAHVLGWDEDGEEAP